MEALDIALHVLYVALESLYFGGESTLLMFVGLCDLGYCFKLLLHVGVILVSSGLHLVQLLLEGVFFLLYLLVHLFLDLVQELLILASWVSGFLCLVLLNKRTLNIHALFILLSNNFLGL